MIASYLGGVELTGQHTLPDHDRCDTHRKYKLGCAQYERLLARSGQQCEICRATVTHTKCGKLHIDHSGPDWAVRGLLCGTCNTRLRDGTGWFSGSAEYLARTWWVEECARLGVSTTIMPEPDIGSAIRDQFEVVWVREADGKWRPSGSRRPGISFLTWERVYELRGPQNMAPFNVYGPEGNVGHQWTVERALRSVSILAPDREELIDQGRWDMAHCLLAKFHDIDRKHYEAKARRAAGDYEPTTAELERCEIDLAVACLIDERDRLYDMVMGFLHALPDGKDRWDRACARMDADPERHTPTDVIEEALFSALTDDTAAESEQVMF